MPEINETQLKEQLKQRDFARCYLLYGEDVYLKQHYADRLANLTTAGAMADFNLTRFENKDMSVDILAETAELMPMMSEYRCALVNDLDPDKLSTVDFDKLQQLLSDPPQSCVMVFWYSGVQASKTKSARWKVLYKLIGEHGCSVRLNHMNESALSRLLCSSVSKRGSRMHPTVARRLIERAGRDLQLLQNEVDKLCAWRPGQEITRDDVERLSVRSLDASAFDLVRAIRKNNTDAAMTVLAELFDQRVEPIMILGALSSSYVDMYRAHQADIAGIRPQELATRLGYKNKERLRYAQSDASGFSLPQLRSGLDTLLDADRRLKGSSADSRVVLQETVIKLLAGRHSRKCIDG